MLQNWFATFTDLREHNIPLSVWLEYHRTRRAVA
jgi:hypothetical protein